MRRFSNRRTEDIYNYGYANGVPKHIGRVAHFKIHILTAAHEVSDLRVVGPIATRGARWGARVDKKWFLTFKWEVAFGATAIKLERW